MAETVELKKKKMNEDSYYIMGEPWKYYAKWKKPVTTRHILYNFPFVWNV